MSQYYFVGASLPSLSIDASPELSYQEVILLFEENFSRSDLEKVAVIRRYYDLYNIRSLMKGESFSLKGNYDRNELEERLLTYQGLPEYVQEFLDIYDTPQKRIQYFSYLLVHYFQNEKEGRSGFLRKWLDFERKLRIVLVALRAKAFQKDVAEELQFEDVDDDLVADVLAQKDAHSYTPPEEFLELKTLYEQYQNEPLELNQKIEQWRFHRIAELEGDGVFSIDHLLGYLVRLVIVEKWFELNKERGLKIIDSILKDAS